MGIYHMLYGPHEPFWALSGTLLAVSDTLVSTQTLVYAMLLANGWELGDQNLIFTYALHVHLNFFVWETCALSQLLCVHPLCNPTTR